MASATGAPLARVTVPPMRPPRDSAKSRPFVAVPAFTCTLVPIVTSQARHGTSLKTSSTYPWLLLVRR